MSLSQIELVWVRFRVFLSESERSNKVSSKMAVAESWQNSRWLTLSSWVRMNELSFFCSKWLNPRWQNSRWLSSSSWVRMNEWNYFFVQNGWIWDRQNSRWLTLSSWVTMNEFVRLNFFESESRLLNLRWQNSRWLNPSSIQDGCSESS